MARHDSDTAGFDRAFFDRFYRRRETRASGPDDFRRLSQFVLSYLEYLEIDLVQVLDLGCGLGRWKKAFEVYDPRIRFTGVDISPYTCEEYGWTQASVDEFRSAERFDLVICQDVLPYLSKDRIEAAIGNIARHCRGAAYLQMVTEDDWDNDVCDPARTDFNMNRFGARWYRRILGRHFINCGGGVFLPRNTDVVLWELEHC